VSAPAVLIPRPEPQAQRLAAELRAEGWAPLIWPLLRIEPLARADLTDARAVLFTSANAVAQAAQAPIPALCVGEATARAARAAGFADVRAAEGDAASLGRLVVASLDPAGGPLAFVRGETVAADLAGALRAAGFDVREQVVYAARPETTVPTEIDAAMREGGLRAALFYSPRTAAAFAALAAPWRAGLARAAAVAISPAAAAPLRALGFSRVIAAKRPDDDAVRAALAATRPQNDGD
jgi:uroporphyrinogen-III synthase